MLKELFQLDPEVTFLNHGSFGAAPKVVFADYQAWQLKLEQQPVRFIQRDLPAFMSNSRQAMGDFVGADPQDLVFVPNPTFAVNTIARSLELTEGDQVLTTNLEYGACMNAWTFMSRKKGFSLIQQPITLPVTTPDAIVEEFWAGVTPQTKVIFLSHITSTTALTLPVGEVVKRARNAGILSIIDGAHVPSQLDLNIRELDPDFYTGAGHKWLCTPKGVTFFYARRDRQSLIDPLVIGWGWGEDRLISVGSDFLDYHEWLGTKDMSAYLSVPAAIQFQAEHDWETVRTNCHELVTEAVARVSAVLGVDPVHPAGMGFYQQMGLVDLGDVDDLAAFKDHLYDAFKIEIPCMRWNGRNFLRISVQGYNTREDIDKLVMAVEQHPQIMSRQR